MIRSNFTINLLDKSGVVEKVYVFVADFLNRHLLRRNTFDPELITDAFNALDGFWLKHGKMSRYNDSQIRIIVGTVLEALRDNQLNSEEIRRLTRFITGRWDPEIAEKKVTMDPEVLLPAPVEQEVEKVLEVYEKVRVGADQIPTFVEKTTGLVSKSLSTDKVISSVLRMFR